MLVNEMGKLTIGLSKIWNFFRKPFVVVIAVVLLILFGVYLFSQERLSGDTASHLLLAVSPILKIGVPYKDFWEIKPPMWPLTVFLWSKLFGFGILSIKILNLLLVSLVAMLTYFVYKKLFLSPVFELIFLFTLIINFSPLLNTLILPTEIVGLVLSLATLVLFMGTEKNLWKFYVSGVFIFFASQSKEPFTFIVLGAIPVFLLPLLQKKFTELLKNAGQFLAGMLTGLGILAIYLSSLGSLGSYMEVFKYKEIYFPFSFNRLVRNFAPAFTATNNTFIQFQGGVAWLLILGFIIFLIANKYKKVLSYNLKEQELVSSPFSIINKRNLPKYIAAFWALGSLLGLGLGGSFGSHYLIQAVIPFYILCGLIVAYIYSECLFLFRKNLRFFLVSLIILVISIVIVLPKRQYLKSYYTHIQKPALTDTIYSYEKRIKELTTTDQCVLSVYGWGTGENYLYSSRRPCTRFFLANIVKEDWQKKEYARDILLNPPALIVYHKGGADMDVSGFERSVINIRKIVDNCYEKDVKEDIIFLPRTTDLESLRGCVADSSI